MSKAGDVIHRGGTIESFASKLGLPSANLDVEQLESGEAKRSATLGRLLGVQLGVLLGSTTWLGGWGCPLVRRLLLQGEKPKEAKDDMTEEPLQATTGMSMAGELPGSLHRADLFALRLCGARLPLQPPGRRQDALGRLAQPGRALVLRCRAEAFALRRPALIAKPCAQYLQLQPQHLPCGQRGGIWAVT